MSAIESTSKSALEGARIFFLDLGAGRILSARPDGSDLKVIIGGGQRHPDGLAADPERRHLYWTNMGNPVANDGSIFRSDLDGGNITVIVPPGSTFTPKQLQIEAKSQKLYWCDREGMRVMRCNLDGTEIETLVQTGENDDDRHDQTRWCVGIAVDADGGKIYWTQKGGDNAGQGRIFRAGIEILSGEGPATRSDIELLFEHLPEPIDLDIDPSSRMLYWTDRGDPPRGNTVNRASMDIAANSHTESQIVITHLMEGIGLALDVNGGRMFVTDLAGSVYSANLDGTNPKMLLAAEGNLTGIAYVA
ncbi:3-hydroxyacyl-CoA dehydrogenase [Granulicella sp. L60]|uniref:3-hydroxyacyl-CoA dehydrogenase n=1 Tax=Granulicella sp. L60 TaxID=1641866 RepID=UPI00131B9B8C|nr:3-hydroxyacyl-CoA dehydrogenase [Granulicella sp. L60]